MITTAKISAVRASGVRRLIEGGAYSSKYGNLTWEFFSPGRVRLHETFLLTRMLNMSRQ